MWRIATPPVTGAVGCASPMLRRHSILIERPARTPSMVVELLKFFRMGRSPDGTKFCGGGVVPSGSHFCVLEPVGWLGENGPRLALAQIVHDPSACDRVASDSRRRAPERQGAGPIEAMPTGRARRWGALGEEVGDFELLALAAIVRNASRARPARPDRGQRRSPAIEPPTRCLGREPRVLIA